MEQKRTKSQQNTKNGALVCPVYKKCGGCQLQNMSYAQQLEWKQGKVQRLLGKFCFVDPIIGMKTPYHYRNKVQAAFRLDRKKQILSGVYQSSTKSVVPMDHCLTEDKLADAIIVTIRKLLKSFKLQPYDDYSERGFLRHVLVKRGFSTGQVMVVLVSPTVMFPSKNNFVKALLKEHPEITTIVHNISDCKMDLVLGAREMVLYGKGTIEDKLCGCTFRISSRSFYQINPVQTEVLYQKAIEFAGLTGKETVIDAYCGIGTIGIITSAKAGHVYAAELNGDAVKDAIANAKRNQCKNIEFFKADAGQFMDELAKEKIAVDVVLMDPPRAGSDERFLTSVAALAPKRVVYISCNPETQERDLRFLTAKGYAVQRIQPVDLFPHTNHVETIVLIQRRNS